MAEADAFAQVGIVGLDGQIEVEALRLCGLPEAAPALLCGMPVLPVGQGEFAADVSWDLPNLSTWASPQSAVVTAISGSWLRIVAPWPRGARMRGLSRRQSRVRDSTSGWS